MFLCSAGASHGHQSTALTETPLAGHRVSHPSGSLVHKVHKSNSMAATFLEPSLEKFQQRFISLIHRKFESATKTTIFKNDQTIWRFKNSNFQHVRISGLCRSRGLLPNLSSMSCILERSSWKQLMASRVLKKRMIGWYSKISKISIGNAG